MKISDLHNIMNVDENMNEKSFSTVNLEELQTALDNKLFLGILDTMPSGVQVLKAVRNKRNEIVDFAHVFSNKAAERITGKELVGKNLSFGVSYINKDPLFCKLVTVVTTNIIADFTQHHDNDVWVHYTIQKLGDGVLIMYRDITEQKEAQEKIKELNHILLSKNRELESVNSELRTLNSIAASDFKETLKHLYTLFEFLISSDARNLSNTGRANIRRAQSAIQKMKLLTDDIIAYSEIQTSKSDIATVQLEEIFKNILHKLEKKIEETNAEITLPKKLPKVKGYPELLLLLFYHLLDNGIKFRREDKPPVLQVQFSTVAGMNINHANADPEADYTVISITDNGVGIDPSEKEKVFEMFHKASDKSKYKGSGIGLAICKKIMDMHEGFITAEQTPENKGTTFNCFFLLETETTSISIAN